MAGKSKKQTGMDESNILDNTSAGLAQRIRDERLARSWSLDEMAKRSGVSRAMIHRVESGASSPTAALLGKISGAFRISMPALLREAPSHNGIRLVRADQRSSWRDPDTGYIREQISSVSTNTARRDRNPEITRVTLPPDARVPFPSDAFDFISQAIWVLEGTLHFVEGDHVHQLEKDDCLTLGDPTDCVFENRSDLPCIYVVVVT